jgi:hypothetical protein
MSRSDCFPVPQTSNALSLIFQVSSMTERAISSSWIDFLGHENMGGVIDLGSKSITLKSAIASSPVS